MLNKAEMEKKKTLRRKKNWFVDEDCRWVFISLVGAAVCVVLEWNPVAFGHIVTSPTCPTFYRGTESSGC